MSERERLEVLAPSYDAAHDFDRYMLETFAEEVSARVRGEAVLDLGCSTGVTSSILALAAAELHVVDGSQLCIDVTMSRLSGFTNVTYHCALFEDFEPARTFDAVVCSHVLEHVEDPANVLRRVRSWLSPGGRLFVYVPNANSLHRRLGVSMGLAKTAYELSERDHRIGHRRVYDPQSLSKAIKNAEMRHGALGGMMLKPFPNAMMEKLDDATIHGLLRLGSEMPELASDIYYECYV